MEKIIPLCALAINAAARVAAVKSEGAMAVRLRELGLIEGTKITCVLKSPFGSISAYTVRGAVIAIRKEDADRVYVCEV